MRTLGWHRAGLIALVALATVACHGGVRLRGQLRATNEVIDQAERNGAYTCAPRELALAKAHASFTDMELGQGYLSRARWHFGIAERNAREAYEKSPPDRCAPRRVVVDRPEPPRPEPTIEDPDPDGDGILDSADHCPLDPEDRDGYQDNDGCPDPDNDLDGVPDVDDRCPLEPEDPDGFEDEDGCPDDDNDADGIGDVQDRCPNTPGIASQGGCPLELTSVVIRDDRIDITQQIHFEFDRAVIRRESYHILDEVVLVLQNYPAITLEVQGHTDSRGADDYNYWLSHDRARAVRQYLVDHGVDAARLTFRGFGESCPIESNRTEAGRAANRRSVFLRTDREFERECAIPTEPAMPAAFRRRHRPDDRRR